MLKDTILKKIQENPGLAIEIYVITPFRNVAYQLIKLLNQIHFPIREDGKVMNIGTMKLYELFYP